MLLDPDGNVYTEWRGYLPPATMLAAFARVLRKPS